MSAQAIFLSYASEDTGAARRICEALRAAGLEVWFDQSELAGGDAWDQKIRRQIKDCTLFVPIISAATNAREEGYFRREWNLAVGRMMDMSDNKAFLFPVLLSDATEAGAIVPEKFRERQWTQINDDAATARFAARLATVLNVSSASSPPGSPSKSPAAPIAATSPPSASRRRTIFAAAIGATSLAGVGVWQLMRRPATPNGTVSTAPVDPALQRALKTLDSSDTLISDITVAEDLVKGMIERNPTDVEATIAMARIHAYMLVRGWDRSEERFTSAKRFGERALSLAPRSADAMGAFATFLYMRRAELPRAANLCRDAIAIAPDQPYAYRMLANILAVTPGVSDDEIIAAAMRITDRFPKDALAQYEVGRLNRDIGRVKEAEKHFELAIKLGPITNAILALARIRLWIYNDLPGMKALLDTIPERMRVTDRAVISQVLYGMASRDYPLAASALAAFSEPWMNDFDLTGPTALLIGEILLLQNKPELAKLRFTEAQAELGRRQPVLSRNFNTVWLDSWVLMRLGKMQEARARNALVHGELSRPFRVIPASGWVFATIPRNLLLGERKNAIELMREAVVVPLAKTYIRNAMAIDPRMTPFRDDREIAAILSDSRKT